MESCPKVSSFSVFSPSSTSLSSLSFEAESEGWGGGSRGRGTEGYQEGSYGSGLLRIKGAVWVIQLCRSEVEKETHQERTTPFL